VKEKTIESVRNAEGGTKVECGNSVEQWTSHAGVAMGKETPRRKHEL
jgi:hypothetical protein